MTKEELYIKVLENKEMVELKNKFEELLSNVLKGRMAEDRKLEVAFKLNKNITDIRVEVVNMDSRSAKKGGDNSDESYELPFNVATMTLNIQYVTTEGVLNEYVDAVFSYNEEVSKMEFILGEYEIIDNDYERMNYQVYQLYTENDEMILTSILKEDETIDDIFCDEHTLSEITAQLHEKFVLEVDEIINLLLPKMENVYFSEVEYFFGDYTRIKVAENAFINVLRNQIHSIFFQELEKVQNN